MAIYILVQTITISQSAYTQQPQEVHQSILTRERLLQKSCISPGSKYIYIGPAAFNFALAKKSTLSANHKYLFHFNMMKFLRDAVIIFKQEIGISRKKCYLIDSYKNNSFPSSVGYKFFCVRSHFL